MMAEVIELHRRLLTAHDRAVTFVQMVGSYTLDGEERPGSGLPPYKQEPDAAVETLQMIVRRAREIAKDFAP